MSNHIKEEDSLSSPVIVPTSVTDLLRLTRQPPLPTSVDERKAELKKNCQHGFLRFAVDKGLQKMVGSILELSGEVV